MDTQILKQKITKSIVDKLQKGETIWDTDVKGFGVRYQTREKVYYLKTRVNSRQRWIAIGQHGSPWTVETARDEARSLLGQKVDGASIAEMRKDTTALSTLNELADRYLVDHAKPFKKPQSYENDKAKLINHIRPKLGSMLLVDIDQATIERLLQNVASGKVAAKQAGSRQGFRGGAKVKGGKGVSNRCRSLLSKMFNLAEKWGMIELNSNPVRHSSKFKENGKERYLSTTELETLVGQLLLEQDSRPYHVAAYRLLILTGARLDEVLSLKWDYVDLERQMLFLPDSKTGKKEIILTNAAVKVLKDLPRIDGNSFVIIGHKDGQHLVNLRKHWTEMRNKIGLQDVRLHDLRHSFASTAIAAGVPIALIGKLLGHKNSKTTERYAHLGETPLRAASELVSEKMGLADGSEAVSDK